jgi:hypothetical protein
MARPPLAMGTHGSISVSKLPAKTKALTALQDIELITHRPDISVNTKLVGMRSSQ